MQSIVSYLKIKDHSMLQLFNQTIQCSFLDIFMNIVTHFGSLPMVILIFIGLYTSGNTQWLLAAEKLSLTMIFSQALVHLFKFAINRPRPFQVDAEVIVIYPPTSRHSFPSGHSCAAFVTALTLGSFFPSGAFLCACGAVLVSLSRVYLGAHYPSDVLAGSILGVISWALIA